MTYKAEVLVIKRLRILGGAALPQRCDKTRKIKAGFNLRVGGRPSLNVKFWGLAHGPSRPRLPHPAVIFGGWDTMPHGPG
jgi:hypothetical protein